MLRKKKTEIGPIKARSTTASNEIKKKTATRPKLMMKNMTGRCPLTTTEVITKVMNTKATQEAATITTKWKSQNKSTKAASMIVGECM